MCSTQVISLPLICWRCQQMLEIHCDVFRIAMAKLLSTSQWSRKHIVKINCKCLFSTRLKVLHKMSLYRALATSPVSLVSTGPLFSSFLVCLTLPTSVMAQLGTYTHNPHIYRMRVVGATCWKLQDGCKHVLRWNDHCTSCSSGRFCKKNTTVKLTKTYILQCRTAPGKLYFRERQHWTWCFIVLTCDSNISEDCSFLHWNTFHCTCELAN